MSAWENFTDFDELVSRRSLNDVMCLPNMKKIEYSSSVIFNQQCLVTKVWNGLTTTAKAAPL